MCVRVVLITVVRVLAVRLFGRKALQPFFKIPVKAALVVVYEYNLWYNTY